MVRHEQIASIIIEIIQPGMGQASRCILDHLVHVVRDDILHARNIVNRGYLAL